MIWFMLQWSRNVYDKVDNKQPGLREPGLLSS